jgi:hypothetical protein
MKIATRIALLQWQANPADPANFWRLILAWITPGVREPQQPSERGEHAGATDNGVPLPPELLEAKHPPRPGTWRIFVAGALCGVVCMAAVWAGSTWWWKPSSERSAQDSAMYDDCLIMQGGNATCAML